MYYVYEVLFKELNAVYVGCTNNLRRRKDQHNENARKLKSEFGKFLNQNNIVLKLQDLKVIADFEDRQKALKAEKNAVLKWNESARTVLNNNYSEHCTRVGLRGKTNPCAKVFVVVNIQKNVAEYVDDLHQYCREHNLTYKTMSAIACKKNYLHKNAYICIYLKEWEKYSEYEKQNIINGNAYKAKLKDTLTKVIRKRSKTYVVETPSGETEIVTNLDAYAKEKGINAGNLHGSLTTGRKAAGYRVIKRV